MGDENREEYQDKQEDPPEDPPENEINMGSIKGKSKI